MEIINLLEKVNWQTVIAMFAIGWYFTRDIRKEMHDFRIDMKEQGKRIDHLYQICVELLKEKKS